MKRSDIARGQVLYLISDYGWKHDEQGRKVVVVDAETRYQHPRWKDYTAPVPNPRGNGVLVDYYHEEHGEPVRKVVVASRNLRGLWAELNPVITKRREEARRAREQGEVRRKEQHARAAELVLTAAELGVSEGVDRCAPWHDIVTVTLTVDAFARLVELAELGRAQH